MMGFHKEWGGMAGQQSWPAYDESKTVSGTSIIAIQVGGKLRGTVDVPVGSDNAAIEAAAREVPTVAKFIEPLEIVKVIHVPGKLVNFIGKPKA